MTGTNTAALGAKSLAKLKKLSLVFLTALAVPVTTIFLLVLLLWSVHQWNVPLWATIALGLLLIPSGSYAIWYWARSFAEGRFRFGLRTFLLGIAFTAIILATVGRSVFERLNQGYAVQAVVQSGGYPHPPWTDKNDNWLEAATGYDPFEDVVVLHVRANQVLPIILQHKDRLSDLQQLSFSGGSTDACLKRASELNRFPRLHIGEFFFTQLTDKGLRHLSEWSNVRNLFFNGCAFTDKGLAHLTSLPNLESLTLIDENGTLGITDAGMVHIGKLSTLKTLRLVDIPVTDAGLAHLMKLQGLQELTVRRTSVTEEGMANLRTVLTDCWATGMKHSFPAENQIHQIRVCEDGGAEEEIIVIDNPDRIADIKACLNRYVGPTGVRWHREWETESHGNIRVHFEGSRRRLCSCVVGEDFLRNGRGVYRRLSDAESLEIRDTLGLAPIRGGVNDRRR